jgi:hypothetical protein
MAKEDEPTIWRVDNELWAARANSPVARGHHQPGSSTM